MTEKNMTIQEAAEKALALQNGCNLSGIAHTLSQILSEAIWPAAREQNEGTQWVNRHPIVAVILDKMLDLNGYHQPGTSDYLAAFDAVEKMAKPAAPAARRESCANRLACESACPCTSGWLCRYCFKPEADCLCWLCRLCGKADCICGE